MINRIFGVYVISYPSTRMGMFFHNLKTKIFEFIGKPFYRSSCLPVKVSYTKNDRDLLKENFGVDMDKEISEILGKNVEDFIKDINNIHDK